MLRDLPIQGQHVVVVLEARKFFCENPGCSRRIFCERFPEVVEAYARRTARLEEIVTTMGLLVRGCQMVCVRVGGIGV